MVTRMRSARLRRANKHGGGEEEDGRGGRRTTQSRGVSSGARCGAGGALQPPRGLPPGVIVSQAGGVSSSARRRRLAGSPPVRGRRGCLGATSGTRWRTRPCRCAAAPFPGSLVGCGQTARRNRGAKGGWGLPPRAGALERAEGRVCPLPDADGWQRAAAFVCSVRVLRSAPSPPAQTSLQGREKRH